jgi:hypothetical protein
MKESALKQAKQRLAAARAALAEIERADSLSRMEAGWHDLLVAGSTIYAKLEQGAKGCRLSEMWFAKRKNERKSDALLNYAHQARNSAEHSIEEVAQGAEISVSMTGADLMSGGSFGLVQMPDGQLVPATTGDPTKLRVRGRHVSVVSVRNRGVTYDPPTMHLGVPVSHDPDDVGRHLLRYLDAMISDADTLARSN